MTDLLSILKKDNDMPEKPTAKSLLDMLHRHYLPEGRQPGGVFAAEIQAPASDRRADLIWMPTTIAGGTGLIGHEIKVTRADVLRELEEPAKAEDWSRYCDRWWLVVASPALIEGLEVPEAWGVMAPPSGRRTRSMTIVRKAPKLRPRDAAAGFRRVAAWQMHRVENEIATITQQLNWTKRELEESRRVATTRELTGQGATPHARRLAGILAAYKQRSRSETYFRELNDDEIVAILVDATRAKHASEEAMYALRTVLRQAQVLLETSHLGRVVDHLDGLVKQATAKPAVDVDPARMLAQTVPGVSDSQHAEASLAHQAEAGSRIPA